LEKRRLLGMAVKPCQNRSQAAFTVLEALFASAILALGLFGSFQLSMASMAANQTQRSLDLASGLAQDLAECWGVQTASCLQQFSNTAPLSPLSADPSRVFHRTWQLSTVPVPETSPCALQELKLVVSWLEGQKTAELVWVKRRSSTPFWIGL
jgi:hypothetical protein